MKKRLTSALLALMMTASLCGCGDDPAAEEPVRDIAVETAAEAAETEAETAEVTTAEETAAESADSTEPAPAETAAAEQTAETDNKGAAPVSKDELAEVQRVADTYFKAMKDGDYEALVDVFDVEMLYYLENGETGSREQYLEFLRDMSDEETGASSIENDNVTIGDPVCANEQAEQYNEFFRKIDELSEGKSKLAENFKVDGVYNMRLQTSGTTAASTSTDESGIKMNVDVSGSFDFGMDIPILRINGQWKVDPAIGLIMGFYQMFSGLADGSVPITVNGESVAPTT